MSQGGFSQRVGFLRRRIVALEAQETCGLRGEAPPVAGAEP